MRSGVGAAVRAAMAGPRRQRIPGGPPAARFRPLESPPEFHVFAETLAELGLAGGPLAAPIAGQASHQLRKLRAPHITQAMLASGSTQARQPVDPT